MRLLFIATLVLIAGTTSAETVTFLCYDRDNNSQKVLVVAKDEGLDAYGSIKVAGVTYRALFRMQGFDRRWDFGETKEDGTAPYTLIIDPNSHGYYYDFSTSSEGKLSQLYICRQRN